MSLQFDSFSSYEVYQGPDNFYTRAKYSGIEMNHANECLTKLAELQGRLYAHFAKTSDEHNYAMRLLFPGVGLAATSVLLSLVFRVGAIGEVIFKFLGNVIGGLFLDPKCDMKRGMNQLIVELPKSVYENVITFAAEVSIGTSLTIVFMVVAPGTYCKDQANDLFSEQIKLINSNKLTKEQDERFQIRSHSRMEWLKHKFAESWASKKEFTVHPDSVNT